MDQVGLVVDMSSLNAYIPGRNPRYGLTSILGFLDTRKLSECREYQQNL